MNEELFIQQVLAQFRSDKITFDFSAKVWAEIRKTEGANFKNFVIKLLAITLSDYILDLTSTLRLDKEKLFSGTVKALLNSYEDISPVPLDIDVFTELDKLARYTGLRDPETYLKVALHLGELELDDNDLKYALGAVKFLIN